MTRDDDVRFAVEREVDYLGLNLYPKSPRGVTRDRAVELLDLIPRERRVVVDVEPSLQALQAYSSSGFSIFQIHFRSDIPASRLAEWSGAMGAENLWLAPRLGAETEDFPEEWLPFARTWLVDGYSAARFGGTGKVADWKRFRRWRRQYREFTWVLAGGLTPENIHLATTEAEPDVIDVNSGIESAPGIKPAHRIDALLAAYQNMSL